MHRRMLTVLCLVFSLSLGAQLKSPEQFLGYKIGERFTPHWKIVEYFRSVAAAMPATVRLETYGQTTEGRPLMVAYLSSSANMSNLENIRVHNQQLVNEPAKTTPGSAPAIVWLSYNVHGNEASSSEAAMLTLHALADPQNQQARQWLQQTVVVIDPCLNPDGRDRYVNWYNSVVGKKYNPSLVAREHDEPWPGGRSNHYNFDLNRDWAWQTQVESQQRVALFQRWLPQVHVDFHEQYPDAPYYFAPAAEPYHEVITPWQRDFQTTIGRNHARYFDRQGWLYFTKQYFDLLYPSYGDTYPIFNGSIGMTYEQAGHGIAGLGVQMDDTDTLTLADRASHHFTTSMSTIEVAAQNATKLVSEFQRYFADATTNGAGKYKAYVIKQATADQERISRLLDLLKKNGIRYGAARSGTARGYNYETGKEENFSLTPNDVVVSSVQPKGALVKVLFEPVVALADSFTYDITAWSLPYAYGVKAYATTQRIDPSGEVPAEKFTANSGTDPYAYVIRWNGIRSVKLVSQLLQKGIRLRYSETPFESGGQSFDRGSVILLKTSNQYRADLWTTVRALADSYKVQLAPVPSGFVDKGYDFGSNRIRSMKTKRVALLTGEQVSSTAAGEVWYFFDQVIDYPVTLINAADAASAKWSNFDVVILPNGNYKFLSEKAGLESFRSWVQDGGNVIALEHAVAQLARNDWSLKAKKDEDTAAAADIYAALKKYENREREFIPAVTPGSIFRVELDNTHPLAYGYPRYYYTLKGDDALYEFIKEGGWNVGVIKKEKQVSGFVGSRLQSKLKDGLLFGVQEVGKGTITYLADDVLFRSFWENGKLLFANAVFLVGQ